MFLSQIFICVDNSAACSGWQKGKGCSCDLEKKMWGHFGTSVKFTGPLGWKPVFLCWKRPILSYSLSVSLCLCDCLSFLSLCSLWGCKNFQATSKVNAFLSLVSGFSESGLFYDTCFIIIFKKYICMYEFSTCLASSGVQFCM